MKTKTLHQASLTALVSVSFALTAFAEEATPGYNHKIPEKIMTPDKVETRIGTLEFFDGMPTKDTVTKVYDGQTRSVLETDQVTGGVDSLSPNIKPNAHGSYTVWFGPKAPKGKESNWVQTIPGKSFNAIIRLYGPLQPWFDRTWKPGDFELAK